MMDFPGNTSVKTAASAITVSELNRLARHLLESGLAKLWVEGEVSNVARPASGLPQEASHWGPPGLNYSLPQFIGRPLVSSASACRVVVRKGVASNGPARHPPTARCTSLPRSHESQEPPQERRVAMKVKTHIKAGPRHLRSKPNPARPSRRAEASAARSLSSQGRAPSSARGWA